MRTWLCLLASVLGLTGCAATRGIVREQAARDLACPTEQLDVWFERSGIFHVAGCELQAAYVCKREGISTPCRQLGQRGVPVARREPTVRAKAAAFLDCDPDELEVLSMSAPGRYAARGCGQRVEYECLTRADCCAFTTPGARALEAPPLPSAIEAAIAAAKGRQDSDEAKGSLSKAHIRAVINASIGEVRACYEAALVSASYAGIVVIQFLIAPDGHVQVAEVLSSSLDLPKVEQCLADSTRRRRFAKPAGGGIVIVTYPYVLQLDRPGPLVECR